MRYIIVNSQTNLILNAILWDGVTPWTPPPGTFVVQSDTQNIGATYIAN